MQLTRIDMNSWIIKIADQTILVDPWLVGPFVLYGLPWLLEVHHVHTPPFTPETLPPIDLLLISQGVDDHCHQPTLAKLNRNIPVVASPDAAKTVRKLGYTNVTAITNWQEHLFSERLKITAVPGAIVGANTVENGYYLEDISNNDSDNLTVYYEPHLFRPEVGIEKLLSKVDVAIAPVVAQVFPLLGELVMGPQAAMNLVKTLHPRFFIPTTVGEIDAKGFITKFIKTYGSITEFQDLLAKSGEPTQFIAPERGQTLTLTNNTQPAEAY